jgi:transcriptional regulator GlxA family with amidase domain
MLGMHHPPRGISAAALEPTREVIETVRVLLRTALDAITANPHAASAAIADADRLLDRRTTGGDFPRLDRPGGLAPWQLAKAREMMEESIGGNLDLDEVARTCDLAPARFGRAFRLSTGLSPTNWVRQRRIERAKQLLFGTKLPLAQIALECGFSDQAHFTRAFSVATGSCPGAWRRERRVH